MLAIPHFDENGSACYYQIRQPGAAERHPRKGYKMRLFYNETAYHNARNLLYPKQAYIKTLEDLKQVALHDHVAAEYAANHRGNEDFRESDCLMMDIDNDHSEDPKCWMTPEAVAKDLPGVEFYAITSRNHEKETKKDGKKSTARPRFHLYFPINRISNAAAYSEMKHQLAEMFWYYDSNALDAGRFFFGNDEAKGKHIEGTINLTQFLQGFSTDKQDNVQIKMDDSGKQTVLEALQHINPAELNYSQWIYVGMALKAQGFDFSVFDNWSKNDSRYNEREMSKKWDSFRHDDKYGIMPLIYMAMRNGFKLKKKEEEPKEPPKSPMQLFDEFMAKIQTDAYKPMQTGMPAFDKLLGGGIQKQALVILTAAPGTGKTTFAQQVFEAMAAQGTDVLFFNLEMSREQLLARSLSRIASKQGRKGITAMDVMKGYAWKEATKTFVAEAAKEYREKIAERMCYNPPGAGTDLDSIVKTLEYFGDEAKKNGKPAPVVILDYLHLITTDKREEQPEIIKKAVASLKGYAIKYDTFVFAISANNRATNTSGVISLESGRDTSAIEYSADIQLSLNYAALAEQRKKDNGEQYRANNPDDMAKLQAGDEKGNREMLVQVLKSRMNAPGGKLYLAFNPAESIFIPIDKKTKQPVDEQGFMQVSMEDMEKIPFL